MRETGGDHFRGFAGTVACKTLSIGSAALSEGPVGGAEDAQVVVQVADPADHAGGLKACVLPGVPERGQGGDGFVVTPPLGAPVPAL